jgi:type IV secretory pathway VirB10-like protein
MATATKQKIGALVLTAGLGLSFVSSPVEAATKKKKAKKTTTTKVKAGTPRTLAPILPPPPPPTTVAPVAPVVDPAAPVAPPVAPSTTLSVQEANQQAFARMWANRDNWRFVGDVELSADAEALRQEANSGSRVVIWTGSDARLMESVSDGKSAAIVIALVADPAVIRPEILQSSALSFGRRLKDLKTLKIPNGTALAGVNNNNVGVAVVAFDQYLIQVLAPTRQLAQDAAFVVSTNMGRLLTE